MFSIKTILPFAVLAATATPALAQDGDRPSFDGFYGSVAVGVGFRGDDANSTVAFDTNRDGRFEDTVLTSGAVNAFTPGFCDGTSNAATPGNCDGDRNKIDYAARLGYDARVGGNFVLGALLEVGKSDSTDGTTAFSSTPAGYSFSRKLDHAFSARLRAGFVAGENLLIYGTGGASYAKIHHGFTTTNTANSFSQVNDDKMVWGYQAGGGAEIMLGRNVSLGAEYIYSRYNDDKYYVAVGAGTAAPTNPFLLVSGGTNMRPANTDFGLHSVRATLSFRF